MGFTMCFTWTATRIFPPTASERRHRPARQRRREAIEATLEEAEATKQLHVGVESNELEQVTRSY